MRKVYPRYKVYIKKNANDSSGKRLTELTGATYTWTVSCVSEQGVAELSEYSGTTSFLHVFDPPRYVHEDNLVVVEEACQHYTIDTVEEVAPTCTHTGSTEGKKCRGCGEFLIVPDIIPALGHDFVYDVIERTRICRTCGAIKDEDQPVKIMQSDITRLMNIVEEFMLDDAATMLDTTDETRCAAKVFIQQYTYTYNTVEGDDSTRETESPEGEFHIYFEDTQSVRHYLTLTPVGDYVILSHGTYDMERLQSTAEGKEGLPSRFKIIDDNIVGLFETGDNHIANYYLVNSTEDNIENNISIQTSAPSEDTKVQFYQYTSPTTVVSTVEQGTPYVLAAKIHGASASDIQDNLCYVTGIIVR